MFMPSNFLYLVLQGDVPKNRAHFVDLCRGRGKGIKDFIKRAEEHERQLNVREAINCYEVHVQLEWFAVLLYLRSHGIVSDTTATSLSEECFNMRPADACAGSCHLLALMHTLRVWLSRRPSS